MMSAKYFVSYTFMSLEDNSSGNGNIELTCVHPIKTYQEILDIEKGVSNTLLEKKGLSVKVIINNYIRLKG